MKLNAIALYVDVILGLADVLGNKFNHLFMFTFHEITSLWK